MDIDIDITNYINEIFKEHKIKEYIKKKQIEYLELFIKEFVKKDYEERKKINDECK